MAILVIGATGNVGSEVFKSLGHRKAEVIAAVSSLQDLNRFPSKNAVLFDFGKPATWELALERVDKVFLMRPPAIADVKKFIFPFIDLTTAKGVKQIVFLSLQGVRFNPLTPHHKVEKYMRQKKMPYTFLRPNFFMQNLTTFYRDDIAKNDEIYLPAGRGRTAFIDVRDIGEVAAKVLCEPGYISRSYTLSGGQALDYYEVANVLSEVLHRKITYKNPSIAEYTDRLRSKNADESFVNVQKMLYFVVRHNFSASTKSDVSELLGRPPISFKQFVQDHAELWSK